ncbi:HupE/UreJ family protein [Methyloceanibacter methanicus]|uniref:HupE/UreJ family protein n=1 Tax=Methyloceanibacter methanicus TaxID=1774968 RepID=UPI000B0EA5E8|nr:HupE/UreJ family protein [Methyloceanibacter methanicus]
MEHILLGIDHLLFVLALLLLVRDVWMLVKVITAFTVAHSITLVLAALGWAQIPQAPVEAVIALSIMFVAAEVVRQTGPETDLTKRVPWLVAFAFGLLHGLGFGGALKEIGLPQSDVPLALLTFNLGVEAGQLLFVFAVLGAGAVLRRLLSFDAHGCGRPSATASAHWRRSGLFSASHSSCRVRATSGLPPRFRHKRCGLLAGQPQEATSGKGTVHALPPLRQDRVRNRRRASGHGGAAAGYLR